MLDDMSGPEVVMLALEVTVNIDYYYHIFNCSEAKINDCLKTQCQSISVSSKCKLS